jgi:transcriptional regulator with XRE-family HTH domain
MDGLVARFRAHDGWRSSIVAARVARGLTQEQVARAAGIDPTTLSRWEKFGQQPPTWMQGKVEKLRGVLRTDMLGFEAERS